MNMGELTDAAKMLRERLSYDERTHICVDGRWIRDVMQLLVSVASRIERLEEQQQERAAGRSTGTADGQPT